MIGIGIIGCGTITRVRHAPEYAANGQCALRGFYDPIPGRAAELAAQYGAAAYDSLEALLAAQDIDAVSVCTSNDTHAAISVRALDAGKHVLCEKPMAADTKGAQEMVRAAGRSGKVLMIGHNQRLAPAHALAKQILESGELGRVLSFQTTFSHAGPESWLKQREAKNIWFYNASKSAFGVLGDLGIHKIDLMCYLLDEDVEDVHAFVATLDKRREDGTPIGVEDNAAVALRFKSGAVGTMLASWTSYGAEDNSTVLNCQKGIMRIYRDGAQLRVILADGTVRDYEPGAIQTNDCQTKSGVIDLFIKGILRGESPIPGEEGLRALRVAEKCVRGGEEEK